jgi:hypothetical protein
MQSRPPASAIIYEAKSSDSPIGVTDFPGREMRGKAVLITALVLSVFM